MQRPTARPDRGPNKKSLALILAACLIALPAPPPALAVVVETRTVEHIAAALPTQTTDNSRPVPPAARDYALGQADLATVPVFSGGAQESDPESDPDGQMYYKNQYKYQSPDSGSDLTIVESIIYLRQLRSPGRCAIRWAPEAKNRRDHCYPAVSRGLAGRSRLDLPDDSVWPDHLRSRAQIPQCGGPGRDPRS